MSESDAEPSLAPSGDPAAQTRARDSAPAPACELHPAPRPMDRRSFLVWTAGLSLGAGLAFSTATVVQALMPPGRSIDGKTKVGKLAVAKVSALEEGKPKLVEYGDDVLFVTKIGPDKVNVFDAACPHVRCRLHFNEASKEFDCPCHASSFDINGKKLGGPAPRDMYVAYFKIVNGEVVVSGLEG